MTVLGEVVIPDEVFYKTIVKAFYDKARIDFYRYGNDHYSFEDFESWCKSKYYEAVKGKDV